MEHRHIDPASRVGGCFLCRSPEFHSYRECPTFLEAKRATSALPYRDAIVHSEEEIGFLSAGILPVDSSNRVLLILERRRGKDGFNFIGGKRESLLERLETPVETACAEFEEETGSKPVLTTWRQVLWFPQSKYLLFVIDDPGIVASGSTAWFSIVDLEEENLVHEYVKSQLKGDFSQLIRKD